MGYVVLVFATFGCATNGGIKQDEAVKCERYVEKTQYYFGVVLARAMENKAYAAYSLGYSDILTLQLLKDDYKFYYVDFKMGSDLNMNLDRGYTCAKAKRMAYSKEDFYLNGFQEFALSSMKDGRRRSLQYPLDKKYALDIINLSARESIMKSDSEIIEIYKRRERGRQ